MLVGKNEFVMMWWWYASVSTGEKVSPQNDLIRFYLYTEACEGRTLFVLPLWLSNDHFQIFPQCLTFCRQPGLRIIVTYFDKKPTIFKSQPTDYPNPASIYSKQTGNTHVIMTEIYLRMMGLLSCKRQNGAPLVYICFARFLTRIDAIIVLIILVIWSAWRKIFM